MAAATCKSPSHTFSQKLEKLEKDQIILRFRLKYIFLFLKKASICEYDAETVMDQMTLILISLSLKVT